MQFRINKVAVLGSGLMGSGIACLLAGAGFEILLLDLASESDDRNKIVADALAKSVNSKPSPLYHKNFINRIRIGNFDDDLFRLTECDWIIEAIVEKIELKTALYEKIESFRKKGSLISSNTSGIPINLLAENRSIDFQQHFCGTHFFNPPRYLKLLEIIPTEKTASEVVNFFLDFGKSKLGKETVLCNDTPGFIANRIGVVCMSKIFEIAEALQINISDADKLTGPAMGRPKSGTFRLTDLVGLDTAGFVIAGLKKNCPDDKMVQELKPIKAIDFLLQNKFYGNKSGQGFYKKTGLTDSKGKSKYSMLDLNTLEYLSEIKTNLESIQLSKQIEELPRRLKALIELKDSGAELIRKSLGFLFAYASQRIPEITDNIYNIDLAMRSGFAWEAGPFEYWDAIGFEKGLELIAASGEQAADWIVEMKSKQADHFYIIKNEERFYYNWKDGDYLKIPGQSKVIPLLVSNTKPPVFKNEELILHDIGDGVLCIEFKSKYNAIGEGILRGIQQSIQIAEEQGWNGIVIGNKANNFTVGANLMLIGMLAFQQEYLQLETAVRLFQQTSMRCRYSAIPVIASTQGYVFGGGVEFMMHCDATVCAVESYIGLVEAGVGLIPGGGGTKEFALRLSNELKDGEVQIPQLINRFKTIATAGIATSAYEGFDYGYLDPTRDSVCMHTESNIYLAKQKVLQLATNYIRPIPREDIQVLGQQGLAALYIAIHSMKLGLYASEHDAKIANKIAYVICGGDLSLPQKVSETYLLDLEREAFLSLCTEPKTLERIQYMLENNKPLRN
jgi:3-hydroxyacyl-CoA dehydrogenase